MSKIELLMRSLDLDDRLIEETMQKVNAAGQNCGPADTGLILLGNGNAEAA